MRVLTLIVIALWGGLFFSNAGHASSSSSAFSGSSSFSSFSGPSDCLHIQKIAVDHIKGVSDEHCFLKCLMKRPGGLLVLSEQFRKSGETVASRYFSDFYQSSGAYLFRQNSLRDNDFLPVLFVSDSNILYFRTRRLRI